MKSSITIGFIIAAITLCFHLILETRDELDRVYHTTTAEVKRLDHVAEQLDSLTIKTTPKDINACIGFRKWRMVYVIKNEKAINVSIDRCDNVGVYVKISWQNRHYFHKDVFFTKEAIINSLFN